MSTSPSQHTNPQAGAVTILPTFTLPSPVLVALGLIGGVLQYLNIQTFDFAQPWKQLVVFGLFLIPLLGATILTGPAFRAAIHLPVPVVTAIGVLMAALAAAITTFGLTGEVKGILEGVLDFLAFVGFNPVPSTVMFLPTSVAASKLHVRQNR